jgi:hypothetical protein
MRSLMGLVALFMVGTAPARGADAPASPHTIPPTRPDMKRALENLKDAKPRLPMPPLTAEEKEKLAGRRVVGNAAFFNRLTEAARLQLEE